MTVGHTQAIDDLTWLFTECESQMGVHSNFSSLILAAKVGTKRTRIEDGEIVSAVAEGYDNEDRIIDRLDVKRGLSRLAATAKNRRIMIAYSKLHVMHQRILEHAFEARQLPPEVVQAFGDAAGIAPITGVARGISKFTWAWLAGAVVRKDPKVAQIKREADRLFNDALEAYGRAKSYTPEEPETIPEPVPETVPEPQAKTRKRAQKTPAEEASP